jgi:hypothetical protein
MVQPQRFQSFTKTANIFPWFADERLDRAKRLQHYILEREPLYFIFWTTSRFLQDVGYRGAAHEAEAFATITKKSARVEEFLLLKYKRQKVENLCGKGWWDHHASTNPIKDAIGVGTKSCASF